MTCFSHLYSKPSFLNNLGSFELTYLSPDEKIAEPSNAEVQVPVAERLLLNMREAAELLSMSEQALRDLVHKGRGPETVKRGKRVCFTPEGLNTYVNRLPREQPHQGIVEAINRKTARPRSVEEQSIFGN